MGYTLIVIIDPDLDADKVLNKILNCLKSIQIIRIDRIGIKNLAYTVRNRNTGFYFEILYFCDLPSDEQYVKLSRLNEVLKYAIFRRN